MKKVFLSILLLGSMSLMAQEVTTYEQLSDDKIKVTVYNGEKIIQEGYLIKDNDKLRNNGIWKQYDNEGNLTLKVKYVKGKRTETIAYQDNQVIKIYRKD